MAAGPDLSQADLEAMEESPLEGWKAHLGSSQEDLGALEKPSQADLKTRPGPDEEVLRAFSRVTELGLEAWEEELLADLMSGPVDFVQAQVPPQDCLAELPEEESTPSLIDSTSSAGLSEEAKVCLPLKTGDQRLLPKAWVEGAQIGSSVKQGIGGSQTGLLQASYPQEEAEKPSQSSEMQARPLNPKKLEESQTSTFQRKQNSKPLKKKMKVPSRISHETSQDCQLLSTTSNSQTGSPQPALQDSTIEQGRSEPRDGLSVFKKSLCLYSYILCPMNKGVMLKIMSPTEAGLVKEGRCLYVCDKFLMGQCQDGVSCLGYHTLLPFHWQFLRKEDNSWHSVSFGTQLHLEMLYSNPNICEVKVSESPGFTTFLDVTSQSFSKNSDYSFCRRLSCQKDSFFPPCDILYCFNGGVWTIFRQEVQNVAYNCVLHKCVTMDDGRGVRPDLENSLEWEDEWKPSACYRPKYTPLHLLVHNLRIWNLEEMKYRFTWVEDALDLCLESHPELKMNVKIPRNQHFILMEIRPSEYAYQFCCKCFHISMNPQDSVVLRIFQVYNPELWEQYKREKEKMRVYKPVFTFLERYLFHETTMNLEQLAANGLDSKSSRYDGLFGYGTYFSLTAETASLMSSVYNPDFGHVMVLAKVLVGEYTVGQPGLQAPPFKPDGQQFDSCVNNVDLPTLFVVFKEQYIFPRFIILYKHFKDPVHLTF